MLYYSYQHIVTHNYINMNNFDNFVLVFEITVFILYDL